MRTDFLTPLIGISALLLVIGAGVNKTTPEPVKPALPVITSETQLMSVDELHARFRRVLNETAPNHYFLNVDKDGMTFTLDQWSDGMNAFAVNQSLKNQIYLNKWNTETSLMTGLCADFRHQLEQHGHPEYTMIFRLVNCDDFSQIFAVTENGTLVYDVVADTPPGGEIPDPTKRAASTDTPNVYGDYVLNLYSKVIPIPDCRYAPQLSAVWRKNYTGLYEELLAQGYRPCKICNP